MLSCAGDDVVADPQRSARLRRASDDRIRIEVVAHHGGRVVHGCLARSGWIFSDNPVPGADHLRGLHVSYGHGETALTPIGAKIDAFAVYDRRPERENTPGRGDTNQ